LIKNKIIHGHIWKQTNNDGNEILLDDIHIFWHQRRMLYAIMEMWKDIVLKPLLDSIIYKPETGIEYKTAFSTFKN